MNFSKFIRRLILHPFRYYQFHSLLPLVYRLRYSSDDPSSSLSADELHLSVRRELADLVLSYNPKVVVDYGCGYGVNALL